MCGISGIFNPNGLENNISDFINATQIVSHRGQDGQGFVVFDTNTKKHYADYSKAPKLDFSDSNLAFGHRRLAVIDISSAGLQPMSNENKLIWIVYNGEIYNYIELRQQLEKIGKIFHSHTDTEVIIKSYEEWGEDCVNHFNGIWSFAILDLKRNILFCSRDRFGVKPFYYYFDGERFVFGSEIKQLLQYSFVPRKLNEIIAYEYLAYSVLEHCEETFFENIFKLKHGYNLIFDINMQNITLKPYYEPLFKIDTHISTIEASEEFKRLLTDSVRLQLRSDIEVGSCLSGGLDSSSLVCLMKNILSIEGNNKIPHTFSSHFDVKEANELEYMQEVIQKTGVSHSFTYPTSDNLIEDMEHLIWHQEEPFGSTSIFAQWSVFKLVNKHGIKVMLDGQGADEQLAGYVGLYYEYLRELKAKKKLSYIYEVIKFSHLHKKPILEYITPQFLRYMYHINQNKFSLGTPWLNPNLVNKYQGKGKYLQSLQFKEFDELEYLNNMLFRLTFMGNLQQLLRYEDKNSMAFSVESRVPFLDHRLVEFIFSLPSRFKMRDGMTKRVMRDGMVGVLPEKIRCRVSKLGFATPEKLWQNTTLKPLIEEAIRDNTLRDFIVPEKALSYFKGLQDSSLTDFAPWKWLNFSLWRKIYNV